MTDKISALCISHSSRYGLLQRAIYNFIDQTHKNSELVVLVVDINYHALLLGWLRDKRHSAEVREELNTRVIVRHVESGHFGHLATYGIALCTGDYVVVWDDDNLSHPTRLERQLEHSREYPSVFSKSFYYFYDTHELYVTDYAQPGGSADDRCASSSLMFHRSMFPPLDMGRHGGAKVWNASMVALFAASFPEQQYTHIQDIDLCLLFMQCSTGDNLHGQLYHRTRGGGLPATWTRDAILESTDKLEDVLKGYRFSGVESIDVAGKDAGACTISWDIDNWPSWFSSVEPPDDWEHRIPNTPEWNEAKSAS
jgi:hypothetical protein